MPPEPSCHPGFPLPGVLALDMLTLSPDLGDGFGNWALNLPAPDGLRGLRGSLQKLRELGLAEPGEGRPMERWPGIFSRPSAVAGSLTFSPNDSRTVRRADLGDSMERGELCGGCRWGLLSHDFWPIQGLAGT